MAAGDYAFLGEMNEEQAYLFKRSIRTLLDRTFIICDRDKQLYDYLLEPDNLYDVSAYLRLEGFDVMVDEASGCAMLIVNEADQETAGVGTVGLQRFKKPQVQLLLILWLLYLQRFGYDERVYVTVGDITDTCRLHGFILKPSEFRESLRMMKRFSLIDYSNDDIGREDAAVRLYPSLQFGMDIGQLQAVLDDMSGDVLPGGGNAVSDAAGDASPEGAQVAGGTTEPLSAGDGDADDSEGDGGALEGVFGTDWEDEDE